jgi:hypothetical protein
MLWKEITRRYDRTSRIASELSIAHGIAPTAAHSETGLALLSIDTAGSDVFAGCWHSGCLLLESKHRISATPLASPMEV